MSSYTTILAIHVVVAIAGVGLLGAIPIVASFARRGEMVLPAWARPLGNPRVLTDERG
jgi:hypothetical protein